jgi:hypothetical protein
MTPEPEYNARTTPAADVAETFIPPSPHFEKLLGRNHSILFGPRGSGKTTLLKMLTLRALANWEHASASSYITQIRFNAAYVPADVMWGRQIQSLRVPPNVRDSIFVVHTIRAIVRAMRDAVEFERRGISKELSRLTVQLAPAGEENFVKIVAKEFRLEPSLNSILGLELALDACINDAVEGRLTSSFLVETLPSKISFLVTAFNGITNDQERRWALLFDELEIAPPTIQSFLLTGIRSFDERLIIKLAIAPFMEDVGFAKAPTAPSLFHDYHPIPLTYANKQEALEFSSALFSRTFERLEIDASPLGTVFELPTGRTQFGRRSHARSRKSRVPEEFRSLALKDDSFRKYVEERGLFSESYKFSEDNIAQDIRKVLPIVSARDFYLRKFEDGHVVANRSRKTDGLYAGYPSIVEITEGNPRAILTCVVPLAQEYKTLLARRKGFLPVPRLLQSKAIRRVELLLTSLLQANPLDHPGFESAKGLLGFVDQIGRAFEDRLLRRPFATDYVSTFVIDRDIPKHIVNALGKAINAGAIINVPSPESTADAILKDILGKRFRLSYSLAARYRLLLTLGDSVSLASLLRDMRGVNLIETQKNLFG